jgi:hypothetical protein
MNIVDKKDGEWFISRALYPFAHGTREGVRFEPQVPTKIKPDDWIKGQPLIVSCPDPTSGEEMPGPIEPDTILRDGEGKPVQGDPAAKAAAEANAKLNGGDAKKK